MIAIRDRVIIKPDAKEEYTHGGIILLTESQKELPSWGVIVSVGQGKGGSKVTTNAGDYVMFNKYAATPFDHKGANYVVIRFGELFVVEDKGVGSIKV